MQTCLVCAQPFLAKRASAQFCGGTCRKRHGRKISVTHLRGDHFLPAKNVTLNVLDSKGEILAEIDGLPVYSSQYFEVRRLTTEAPEIGSGLRRVFVLAEIEDVGAFAQVRIFSPASGAVATLGRPAWRALRPRPINDYDLGRMRRLLAEDRHAAWAWHRQHRSEEDLGPLALLPRPG